jgi:hypothetical protein
VRANEEGMVYVGIRLAPVALLVLALSLVFGWPSLLPLAVAIVGGLYGLQLVVDDASLDALAPLYAAGLFATAELGYWSLDERERVEGEPGTVPSRVAFVALLALGALLTSMALLALVDAVGAKGLAVDLAGAAAAAGALLVVVLVVQRRQYRPKG